MRRIGIDARLYSQTGVGTYLRNLIHHLPRLSEGVELYIYMLPEDRGAVQFDDPRIRIREVSSRWHTFAEQIMFLFKLLRDRLDLMHFTYFSFPVLYHRKFIATVHDVTPLTHRTGRASTHHALWYAVKHFVFRLVLAQMVHRAEKIITPTQTVKSQLSSLFGKSIGEKTEVIYEGVNTELIHAHEKDLSSNNYEPFLLYVGNFYPHKNVELLINAFTSLQKAKNTDHDSDMKLVLVGPDDMFARRLKSSLGRKNHSDIVFLHDATVSDLVYLYRHARALVNPSHSEGFGLPLVEATYFKCPVIASDIAVFRELLGDEYSAFDPNDMASLQKILMSVQNSAFKPKVAHFRPEWSFETMAEKTFRLYE